MLLGQQNIAVGDTRRVVVRYDDALVRGSTISNVTVAVSAGATSSIAGGGLAPTTEADKKGIVFYVVAGVINEVFTASIQITDTSSEVMNDTLQFTVVAP